MDNKKVMLIILDGWGKGDENEADIIHHANVPFTTSLYKSTPHTLLRTAGEDVGLPEGQMGNSEVGHLNMGAGRIVYQDLVKITQAVRDQSFLENEVLKKAFSHAKAEGKKVHLFGLVSDGGVHSAMDHLYGLCDMAKEMDLDKLFVHAFTDGRDTDPKSGKGYIRDLEAHMEKSAGQIATVCGRYYAMDRDKRWDRIKIAYDMLLEAKGTFHNSAEEAIQASYDEGVTDEFIKPRVITDEEGKPLATVEPGDAVICFNFRTDRLREITTVLTQQDMPEEGMKTLPLHYVTMTEYDKTFKGVEVAFGKEDLQNTLGEVLARAGKTQLRIAETEKYPHVTFFFSGGREEAFDGEERVMIPSPKVATYDLQPEMSAPEVKDAVIKEIESGKHDFICLNFANPDMVGHTGVLEAIQKAVETVDACLREVVDAGLTGYYSMLITADHGNADYGLNPDGSPNTAHTTNPVPCWLIDNDYKEIRPGRLADLAPTILHMMGVDAPDDMEGRVLVQ